jgi:hypothetical protein
LNCSLGAMPERVFYLWQVRSFTVRLALDFVETLAQHIEDPRPNPAEERGGLLFGRVIDNDTVEVTDFEFIRSKHHRGASYDLGEGERSGVERRVRSLSKRSGPKPVGYFRTHLRPGLFLDQSDFALMSESFSDIPGIALAIRTDRPGPSNAGIFFWEDGDIDRARTQLMFPFDAATLHVQGPLEHETTAPAITGKLWAWASMLKMPSASLAWGTAAILAVAMAYQFHPGSGGAQRTGNIYVNSTAAVGTPDASRAPAPAPAGSHADSSALPAVFQDVPDTDVPKTDSSNTGVPDSGFDRPNQTHSFTTAARSPFGVSEPQPASPQTQSASKVQQTLNGEPAPVAVTPALPPAFVSQIDPALPPAPVLPPAPDSPPASARISTAFSSPEPVAPVASVKSVTIDVSLEPREPSGLKRIAGHVPLLGHLHPFRNETGRDFVSARPAASLRPRVPANMTRSIEGEIAVDVVVSIDNQGLVRNTEITKGGETSLALLAADAVRSAPWEPAHSGDHNVAMDIVVHYRFNPAE